MYGVQRTVLLYLNVCKPKENFSDHAREILYRCTSAFPVVSRMRWRSRPFIIGAQSEVFSNLNTNSVLIDNGTARRLVFVSITLYYTEYILLS